MRNSKYRIEELNPFKEWHLHASTDNRERALKLAQEICKQIDRPVRILTSENKSIAHFEPD